MKSYRLASALKPAGVVLLIALAGATPARAIEIAEDLIVDIDAKDLLEGTGPDEWESQGSLGNFVKVGDPVVEIVTGVKAVTFNSLGVGDSYQSIELVPPGLVGLDPTRSIETWVFNPLIPGEETILSWGKRGGNPDGSNMSFNYGSNPQFGAVGHWNAGFQDIGWTTVPVASQWHHLAYTYDGTTTRVYVDGALDNSEVLGSGNINTFSGMPIALAQQYLADGVNFEAALPGRLSIAKVRIHDGVLSDDQILANYNEEKPQYPFDNHAPVFLNAPADDTVLKGLTYTRSLQVTAFPVPTVDVLPVGASATVSSNPLTGDISINLSYLPPDPPPPSFTIKVTASNLAGSSEASWTVAVNNPTGGIEIAEDLIADLNAADLPDGPASVLWLNHGSMGDFQLLDGSEATVTTLYGAKAVNFNGCGSSNDAYFSLNDAPDGIVGIDPTVSIEAWVLNPSIADEETILAWGHRGGPDGTNMSFNYGGNVQFGAVGHWGAAGPDLGWGTVPAPGLWHHLAYTYDGAIQRVYADGVETNSENLGIGVVNTFTPTTIKIPVQSEADGFTPTWGLKGSLSISKVRIHEGVLTPSQIQNNYLTEKGGFGEPPPPIDPVAEKIPLEPVHRYTFDDGPEDVIGAAHGTAYGNVTFENGEAVLNNLGTESSNMNGQSPPAGPPGAYIDLPNGVISALGNQATFEGWMTWNGPATTTWQRIFDFGTADAGEDWSSGAALSYYIFMTPRGGGTNYRFGYRSGQTALEKTIDGGQFPLGEETHVAAAWDGAACTASLYMNGLKVSENSLNFALSDMPDVNNWLGRSLWGDAMMNGSFNEFRIYDYALTPNQVLGNFDAGPNVLNTPPPRAEVVRSFAQPNFTLGQPFGVSLAVTLKAPDTAADIAEVFPAGTSVSEISDGGVLNGDRIEWHLAIPQTAVTYKVTAAGCAGTLQFGSSTWSVGGTLGHVTGLRKISMSVGGGNLGPWLSTDIGAPEGGAVRLADREVLVRGGGSGVASTTTDGFHYLYVPVSGDFEISAKIDCVDDPGTAGLAGLMVRETLDPFSAHLFISLSSAVPASGSGLGVLRCDFRRETLATRTSQILLAFQPKDVDDSSVYLKVRRANNPTTQARTVYFERSADGVTWTPLSSKVVGTSASQLNIKEDALIGLAVTSGGKGTSQYSFRDVHGVPEVPSFPGETGEPLFKRGDADGNGQLEITDVIFVLGFQFRGDPATMPCFDASDVDDNGVIDINDPVYLINWLFLAGADIPAPGPRTCGKDPSNDAMPDPCVYTCTP